MMSIALFVESNADELQGLPAKAQTLLVAHSNKISAYHRVSNGSRGKGQIWKPLTDYNSLPDNPIITSPVGVALTERDIALADMGQITNISIKAIYNATNADPMVEQTSHREIVNSLIMRLTLGDNGLADYVTDKRSNTGKVTDITINPITDTNIGEQIEHLEYEVKHEPIVPSTSPAPADTLSLIKVPDPKWAQTYINRKINGVTDFDIFDYALANGVNVLIEGGAGTGKTIAVQSYASARKYPYFNVSNNTSTEPSELFGQWIPTPDGKYRWQDGAVTQLVRNGGVLLLNEVNFLPARVSTVLFSLLDYRREIQLMGNGGEVIKAHPNLLIVADMNYGYRGTQELNQAFNDRFGIKLEFAHDRAIEMKVVKSKALLTLADQLREQYDKEEITNPISTRALVAFVSNAKHFGMDFAIMSFVNSFNKEERNGVRLACDTHKDNIAQDLGLLTKPSHPVSPDEVTTPSYTTFTAVKATNV
jgi:hypothetical protein